MLAERIHNTLRFFDLQSFPLTSYEIHQYLIADLSNVRSKIDESYELNRDAIAASSSVHLDTIITQLYILTREGKIICKNGFYALPGKEELITQRQKNYLYGLRREKLVRRYLTFARHIPFVRGVALAGSQALGQQRATSDIDLLIITDARYMWTARTLLSSWFQLFGVRRHGRKIANRFCLNHYLSQPREVDAERNLYKAMEYTKLRPAVYPQTIVQFQTANEAWIKQFFPNVDFRSPLLVPQSKLQQLCERMFSNRLGLWLEHQLATWQYKRIRQDQFVFVRSDELSFHPESKHEALLQGFFKL